MRAPRNRNVLDWEQAQGWAEGARDGARAHALTGLDLMPRGLRLVRYVADMLGRTDLTAASIARRIGYTVEGCSARLAQCGYAPLGRDLMDRAYRDHCRAVMAA